MHRGLRFSLVWVPLAVAMAVIPLPAWSTLPCAQCHPREAATFSSTPMGRSLALPAREPPGKFTHPASNTRFSIEWNGSRMLQDIERNGVAGEYEPAYAIGSGTHAVAYLIQLRDHLFQSPLCYYAGHGWDMAPGYEGNRAPDFYRPINPNCLFCHSGQARPVPDTINTYRTPPFEAEAITCERCHGPVETHLRAPLPGSIINPAKLPPRERASVCEQCHLSGEAEIPNPGKQLIDFRPGEDLEEVYTVYVSAGSLDPASAGRLRVISQSQQLALSTCARRSPGKLWCGTCHNPHELPADPKTYFRDRCLSCHGAALLSTHPKPNDDCIGCHMPRRPVTDGGHTVFTDHHIARRPPPDTGTASTQKPGALVAWHDPPAAFAQRNLGLAELQVGERLESSTRVMEGFQLLLRCWSQFPNDPPVLTGIGEVLLSTGRDEHAREAVAVFERAIHVEPHVAWNYFHAGLACKAAHDPKKAAQYLEEALQLDPLLEQAYPELAAVYQDMHDTAKQRHTYDRYLQAFPQNIQAQLDARKLAGR